MGIDLALLFKLAASSRLERSVKALPGSERARWRAASRYVAGHSSEEALRAAASLLADGHGVSIELFGERVTDSVVADAYLSLAASMPVTPADAWLALDLSHLAVDVDPAGAAERLASIAAALPEGRRIQVGAEDCGRTDALLGCVHTVADRGLAHRLGATIHANLLRSTTDLAGLVATGVHIRLIKAPSSRPLVPTPVARPPTSPTPELAFRLAEQHAPWSKATPEGRLREALHLALGPVPVEQPHGVRSDVTLRPTQAPGIPTRVYVPYGEDWFRYWMRRLGRRVRGPR